MRYFDISTKRTFTSNGEEKVSWNRAGKLTVTDDGKMYIQMFHQPDVSYYVFKQEEKQTPESTAEALTEAPAAPQSTSSYPSASAEGINPEDIPF